MSSLLRYTIMMVLSFGCLGVPGTANSQTRPSGKAVANSVSGSVKIHGKAAPGIVVSIRISDFSQQPPPSLKATTDQDGNYQITNIPPGNYQVSPIAPVYVDADFGFSRTTTKSLLLAEGEDVRGIDFSLVRGGVIAGRVTDADGRPVIEERITVLSEEQGASRGRNFGFAGGFQTDDRGMYRIYGLAAGRYRISVGIAEEDFYSAVRLGRVAYKRVFHPDASEEGEAKIVEVSEGSEATNIDITLGRSLPGFAASGRVVDGETGKPVAGLRFSLRRIVNSREAGAVGVFSNSNIQGEFRLENIPPGKYGLSIAPQPGSEARAESVFFEIIDHDVTELLLTTVKGLTLTGIIRLDGPQDQSVFAKLAELRVRAFVRNETGSSPSTDSPINAEGAFRIGGLTAGTVNFALFAQDRRPPVNFKIVRVERDAVVQPRGLEIKAGEDVSGVRLIVSYGTGAIRGEVKFENGPLPPGGRVMVWIKKLGETASNFRPSDLDARGHFLIDGVAAGNYELNVSVNGSRQRPPPSAKQPISVSEGTITDVVVVLDLKEKESPDQ